jgi:hypothetical protein
MRKVVRDDMARVVSYFLLEGFESKERGCWSFWREGRREE